MLARRALFLLAPTLIASNALAQVHPDPRSIPPWADTTGESDVYPNGDAVGVYRAALDLLYIDGDKRPTIILMHDTAERRGGGPCPVACDRAWAHKSRIDTATILSFARVSPKRPRIHDFGYTIPIVFLSDDDLRRMRYDGKEYLATHKAPSDVPGVEQWVEFAREYPAAWGLTSFTKVGFNDQHTEALVQVHQSCGEMCRSDEILFLKRINATWTVIERIPNDAEAIMMRGNLRYRGPAGTVPNESELLDVSPRRSPARSESSEAAPVYQAVLDSLYSFQGGSPERIVITDKFRMAEHGLPPHKSRVDAATLQGYAFFEAVRAPLDPDFKYRLPVAILPGDSMPTLEERGKGLAQKHVDAGPFWLAFREKYPGAWGMVGFSRVAFNPSHSEALVYSNHQCGLYCDHGDTWILRRSGERWRIVERIPREHQRIADATPREQDTSWELEPLKYLGLDAKPNSYRHRLVYAAFTNAVTHARLSSQIVRVYRSFVGSRVLTTDSAGRFSLGKMPFNGFVAMSVPCPDQSRPDSIFAGDFPATPGVDTTISVSIDFRKCFRTSRDERQPTLTGAQAFISETEARFVFPRRAATYTWDLPLKGTYPGSPEYMWGVSWNGPQVRDGQDPFMLWLIKGLNPGGPRTGSLAELIAGTRLEPMINCLTCDGAAFADPKTDHKNAFARVENGQLVFTIRGREAVRRVFPIIPRTVTFDATVRHVVEREYGPGETEESQPVVVNCHRSDSTAASRRRCDVPPKSQAGNQGIDSTSPRRIQVVVLRYDGASLMRNQDVRIRSEDRKTATVTRSTGSLGRFSLLQQPFDSVTFEALCPDSRRNAQSISGRNSLYLAAGSDTTLQLIVDPRLCSR